MPNDYDLIVIGAGYAGRSAARTAASFGARVAIIDSNPAGGVMPVEHIADLKLRELLRRLDRDVLASDEIWRNAVVREAREHALSAQQELRELVALELLQQGVNYIQGMATLLQGRSVRIVSPSGATSICTSSSFILATGAFPISAPNLLPGDPDVYPYWNVLQCDSLPADLLVIGDDACAVSHAAMLAALGVPATLASSYSRLLPEMDEECAALLQHALQKMGVLFHFGAMPRDIKRVRGKLRVEMEGGNVLQPATVCYTPNLYPNTSDLGLPAAGVQVNAQGYIEVDRYYRTSAHGIYAVGDVIGPAENIENATAQGRAAACHVFRRASKEYIDLMPVRHVRGIPEYAGVGLSEAQCAASGIECFVGRSETGRTLRGLLSRSNGHLKLIFDRTSQQLIGVHCIDDAAADVVSIGQAVMHYGGTLQSFNALVPIETSYGQAYQDAAHNALKQLAST